MTIGQLNTKLSLEAPVLTPDGGGGFTVEWQEVTEVWAVVTDLTGHELLQDAQVTAHAPCRILLHYRDDLTGRMRLSGSGRVYDIVSVRDPDGGKCWLEIIAQMK
ncbi:MAG TPA: phage head closure protein [Patescibacteria group bacterium]|nr:phage head closure protein [Patescibacteria group bacterium]